METVGQHKEQLRLKLMYVDRKELEQVIVALKYVLSIIYSFKKEKSAKAGTKLSRRRAKARKRELHRGSTLVNQKERRKEYQEQSQRCFNGS